MGSRAVRPPGQWWIIETTDLDDALGERRDHRVEGDG